jgi:vacuolar-type H+-ATPase subunit E/Vma4
MSGLSSEAEQALRPVRDRLLATARQDAEALSGAAREDAAGRIRRATAQAETLLEQARAEGEAQAADAVARELARAGREARTIVLRARADLADQVRSAARTAVVALRDDPGYPALRERLVAMALAALGTDAVVTEAPDGGIRATRGSRSVDLSLPVLAERAFDRLGQEVTRLWS